MQDRREFIKNLFLGGVSLITLPSYLKNNGIRPQFNDIKKLEYYLTHDIPTKFWDGTNSYIHPRTGIVPRAGRMKLPRVVMTMNSLNGSDVFKNIFGLHTNSLGDEWSTPRKLPKLSLRIQEIDGVKHPVAVSDFWPKYHRASQTLLGTGHTVFYTPDWGLKSHRPRHTSYSIYHADKYKWEPWKKLQMPDNKKWINAGAGSAQRYDKEDGNILLPIYFKSPGGNYKVTVLLCSFDGQHLRYLTHGSELELDVARGLVEPSLTRYKGEYFLTIRNDKKGYVARSQNGLNFDPIEPWKFDTGDILGSYNTQQHWVTHSGGLFLVYTRRTPYNDLVVRSRAPLFMAQVDPKRLRVLKDTERILIPNRGAPLGNFGVTAVSPHETWVTAAEGMLTVSKKVAKKYGADGSVWVARIHWNKPNLYFKC